MGNRLGKTDTVVGNSTSTTNEAYSFDAANRLLTRTVNGGTAANVTSDANGNTVTDASGRTNTWDSQNRLRVCAANGTTSAFNYGSDSLRKRGIVTATDGSKTHTDYVYDGSMQV
jgi:hypothetical protein